eukprot:TRINITY_DN30937_c0_g1_i1.p1 TRINITY_DN30937_c0_g1~~TRINITY_DN30937_c0_g1_i1.p1  ORF type:complete len:402 (+),score=133.98 TRINITY_DN30937_c0_g1_i1:85-1290(+)
MMEVDISSCKVSFEIERLSNPSNEVFEKYIASSTPFIMTDVVTSWPAWSLWRTDDYLLDKVGRDTLLPLRSRFANDETRGDSGDEPEWYGETRQVRFGDFLRQWRQLADEGHRWSEEADRSGEYYYLASLPIAKHFAPLAADVAVPPHPQQQRKSGNLWIGNAGQMTPVHHDFSTGDPGMDGLHAVIRGRKTFRLFDPELNAARFPRKTRWGRFHQSMVDAGGLPSAARYPQFAGADCLQIDLRAGEMLYIPKLWWHHVVTEEPSISVNFWFQHLESERLKLTKHWCVLEQELLAREQMQISPAKMRNVLSFYHLKPSDDDIEFYRRNVHDFMLLPLHLYTYGNGLRAPWIASLPTAADVDAQLQQRVRDWVLARKAQRLQVSEPNRTTPDALPAVVDDKR